MSGISINVREGEIYWWCRCGRSARQPWCDGSHKGGDVTPLKWRAPTSGEVSFCVCKRTASAPLCDGSHAPRDQ